MYIVLGGHIAPNVILKGGEAKMTKCTIHRNIVEIHLTVLWSIKNAMKLKKKKKNAMKSTWCDLEWWWCRKR